MHNTTTETNTVTYLDMPYECHYKPLAWQLAGLTWTASGYGHIPTVYMIQCPNERPRRVWSVCYANAGSLYVKVKGTRVFLRDWEFGDVRDACEAKRLGQ